MIDSSIAVTVNNLSKTFSGGLRKQPVRALVDVSLQVQKGEIYGLLGPNGAGKTTLIKILLGALMATTGSATINGYNINNWRSRMKAGFLPENHRFPPYLTGLQMLKVYGGMNGLSSAEVKSRGGTLLDMVNMSQWKNTRIKKYSKGMMQRLGLAQAMLADPDIIFLDEPTDGVDPVGRHEIRNILKDLKKLGKTIFLNSHLLAEVEAVCDRVAVLNKGKLIRVGPAIGLVATTPTYKIEVAELQENVATQIKEKYPQSLISQNKIEISLDDDNRINEVIDLLRQNQISIISVVPAKLSLEESFIQLIKEGAQDA